MKRIISFLLTVAITFTVISPSMLYAAADEATNMVVGEQEMVADGQDTASDETEKTEKTTATQVDGIVVEVSGDALPKDAEVVADSSSDEKKAALTDAIMGESDEESNAFSLDISLEAEGVITQPGEDGVTVSLSGINLDDCDTVTVYHVMDDVSSIAKRLDTESDILTYTLDNESASHFEKEIAAFHDALTLSQTKETFDENTICVEEISAENGLSVDTESGIISFNTDSFSTYYIAQGKSATERKYSTKSIIKFGDTNLFKDKSKDETVKDKFYIAPDSVITFFSVDKDWAKGDIAAEWTFNRNNSGMTCNVASNKKSATITIPETASVGSESILTVKHTYYYTYTNKKNITETKQRTDTYEATLVVMDNSSILNSCIENCKVYLTALKDSSKGIPSEPTNVSTTDGFDWSLIDGAYKVNAETYFAEKGSNVIDKSILNALTPDVSGTHTWGYVNADVNVMKSYLQGIDWNEALSKLAENGGFTGSDGTKVTSSNKGNYELIPYVIKLQSLSGRSWNIDCYIKKRPQVKLSYDVNLEVGVTIAKSFALPNAGIVNKDSSVTVGNISYDNKVLSVGSPINVKGPDGLTYEYKFLGWGTDRNKVNNNYDPGDKPKISSNVTLHAIWGKQVKVCYNANGGTISGTNYTLDGSGFVKNSSGRFYQNWNYDKTKENGLYNITTFGITKPGYEFDQWDTKPDGTGTCFDQDDKTLKASILEKALADPSKSRCLTLYARWKLGLGNIKITTEGFNNVDEDQVFIFVVKGTSVIGKDIDIRVPIKGDGSALVTDVPFGTYTVSCEPGWSWRYGASNKVTVTIDKMGETENAKFTQSRKDTQWLSGCAYKKNEFNDKNEKKNEENA